MFRGQFQHSIDAKGRVSVPVRFREALLPEGRSQFVVAPDPFDPCLHLFPLPAWEELERKIAALPSLDSHVVRFRRLYVSAASECELDRVGRMLVPPHLRERAALARDVLFAGTVSRVELWARERWDAAVSMTPAELAEFKQAVMEQIRI